MFQRLKGAIDARIAEEQARQRPAPGSLSRSNSARQTSRTASPSRRPGRSKESDRIDKTSTDKGPDPADFEPEFVIDDSDVSSRAGTPAPEKQKASDAGESGKEGSPLAEESPARDPPPSSTPKQDAVELPTDVRVKLRKLDKLEGRYQELLRSYRIAHARVSIIEPFETSLREHTPLTSIADPGALVEYLNQLSLKGDMVMDELKRVTTDRDAQKKKLEEAQASLTDARDEVAALRHGKEVDPEKRPGASSSSETRRLESSRDGDSPSEKPSSANISIKSPNLSDLGISLFSPRKVTEQTETKDESEDFFSYEDELPRLQSELQSREVEIDGLRKEVKTLKGDLAVARESTEGMVQSLETATRELHVLRDGRERHERELQESRERLDGETKQLRSKLDAAEGALRKSQAKDEPETSRQATVQQEELGSLKEKTASLETRHTDQEARIADLTKLSDDLRRRLGEADKERADLATEKSSRMQAMTELEATVKHLEGELVAASKAASRRNESNITVEAKGPQPDSGVNIPAQATSTGSGGSKKNKRKKKGGKATPNDGTANQKSTPATGVADEKEAGGTSNGEEASGQSSAQTAAAVQNELYSLRSLLQERDSQLKKLQMERKGEDELREEVESLRDDLINVGQDHVVAKDRIKAIKGEKSTLEQRVRELEKQLAAPSPGQQSSSSADGKPYEQVTKELESLQARTNSMQTDLSVAQQLAASRFKDLTDLRELLQKAQPELISLRAEVTSLKTVKEDLVGKTSQLRKLESKERDLTSEISHLKKELSQRVAEVNTLNEKVNQETSQRLKAEQLKNNAERDVRTIEKEREEAVEGQRTSSRDLTKVRGEANALRNKGRDLEQQLSKLERDGEGLREEIELKTAQHASAGSLMASMRDQTAEMGMQMKEARERCESLEEELGDAHRLLSERSREGETMRRLLADVEGRADSKVREMRSQMEVAIEERDRAEDEASTIGRRRAREVEELKAKVRDAERSLKRAEEGRAELEVAERAWKKRREELETRANESAQEVKDVRDAMAQLRDTLDENEKQLGDAEKQKVELRRTLEDTQGRLDKLQRSSKAMAEDLRAVKSAKARVLETEGPSSRSSVDSSPSRPGAVSSKTSTGSAAGSEATNGGGNASMDYVYLKNVLLQFLEQRDKKHQQQLIPVLGMLLHFDRKDEQKWMAAIATK